MGTVLRVSNILERDRECRRGRDFVKKQSVYVHGRSENLISLGCEQSVRYVSRSMY